MNQKASDNSQIERYVDQAMFPAVPIASQRPRVKLLWMTPDPLGAMAAAYRMYKGKPTQFSLEQITDAERREAWDEAAKTHLKAPYEFIDLHFFIEGVPRSFTHQMVRQRTAVFAQESLRFAVKEGNLESETVRPPSLDDPEVSVSRRNDRQDLWSTALAAVERAYKALIADGMPAEDARELLPNGTLTRLNYKTNLRNLLDHAGNRLCTQAQFIWRDVFQQIVNEIRWYDETNSRDHWQFARIADSNVFAPVCYELGRCPFKADVDRGCTIRGRVDAGRFDLINRQEWLGDPKAGWVRK